MAEGCWDGSGEAGPTADKLPGGNCFECRQGVLVALGQAFSLRCWPLERKKNLDAGEGYAEVIKGIPGDLGRGLTLYLLFE